MRAGVTRVRAGLIPAALLLLLMLATPTRLSDPDTPPSIASPDHATVEVEISNGHGTGVVVRRGLVLTAAHVVADTTSLAVVFYDGRREPARVAWVSEIADIAAILTETGAIAAAPLACRTPDVGEPIMTIGYPGPLRATRSWGRVAGMRADSPNPATVVLDITTFVGSSGGPVFDADGQLIGIVHSIMGIYTIPTGMPAPVGYTFMVPASTLCRLGL